jgi:hypothetical protein
LVTPFQGFQMKGIPLEDFVDFLRDKNLSTPDGTHICTQTNCMQWYPYSEQLRPQFGISQNGVAGSACTLL